MKRTLLFLQLIALVALSACNKDRYPTIDDLEVKIELVDDRGNITSNFLKGHDIAFKYSITNISDKTFFYMGTPCPEETFNVYSDQGNLIGKPVGEGFVCGHNVSRIEIDPGVTHVHSVVWTSVSQGPNLSGDYYTTFSSHISMLEGKEHRTYDLELEFRVE